MRRRTAVTHLLPSILGLFLIASATAANYSLAKDKEDWWLLDFMQYVNQDPMSPLLFPSVVGLQMERQELPADGDDTPVGGKPAGGGTTKPPATPSAYRWKQYFGTCPVTCGGAYQNEVSIYCYGDKQKKWVADSFCATLERPKPAIACGQAPCFKPRWEVGEKSSCSVSCGSGFTKPVVRCIIVLSPKLAREVEERMCEEKFKPPAVATPCDSQVSCSQQQRDDGCVGPQCSKSPQSGLTTVKSGGGGAITTAIPHSGGAAPRHRPSALLTTALFVIIIVQRFGSPAQISP